ncbi:hypothetical protein [Pseudoalteromonas xiamenensis]
MRVLLLLCLLFTLPVSANWFEKIECGTYDKSIYPYKTNFKPSVTNEELDITIKEFIELRNKALADVKPEHRFEIIEVIERATGKYRKTYARKVYGEEREFVIEQSTIQPPWIISLGNNILIGTDNGEFGGELLRIDRENKIERLEHMNVEDIYKMPFGVVVTSGLAHMHSNNGKISLITPDFKVETLYGLIGKPQSSWLLENGDLLINSYPRGSQVLTKSGQLKRVSCIANKQINAD